MTRNQKLRKINAVLQTVTDRQTIELLNKFYWSEYFKLKGSADAKKQRSGHQ